MKIHKFNENEKWVANDDESEEGPTYPKTIKEFLTDFIDNLSDNVDDWISEVSVNTKLKEYKKLSSSLSFKNSLNFSEEKNFKNFKNYLLSDIEIEKLEKEIEKLKKHRDEVLYFKSSNELLYNFQKELLEKDFDSFYELFLKEQIENEYEYIYDEVHPTILKNKKYKNIIDFELTKNKYNL